MAKPDNQGIGSVSAGSLLLLDCEPVLGTDSDFDSTCEERLGVEF